MHASFECFLLRCGGLLWVGRCREMALFIQSTGAEEFMRAMNPPDLQGYTPAQHTLAHPFALLMYPLTPAQYILPRPLNILSHILLTHPLTSY